MCGGRAEAEVGERGRTVPRRGGGGRCGLTGRTLDQESSRLRRALAPTLARLASCVASQGLYFSFCKMELISPALPCLALWDVVGSKPVLLDRTALETAGSC